METNATFIRWAKILSISFFIFSLVPTFSQVGIGTTTPNGALDITTNDSGMLVPRITLTSTTSAAPVTNPQGGNLAE